jgi:hypothetical protein
VSLDNFVFCEAWEADVGVGESGAIWCSESMSS